MKKEYNPRNFQADIALLSLEGEMLFTDSVRSICLPYNPDLDVKAITKNNAGDV